MMQFSKIFFALLSALALSANAKPTEDGKCPGGYSPGTKVDIGSYWYECRDGKMIPKGCVTDGKRADIGGTFDLAETRMQCVLGPDGFLTVVPKSCLQNGQERQVATHWDDGQAFYACVKDGPNNLRVRMLGCVDQGRQIDFDDKVAKGDYSYQCKKGADGKPKMNIVGCVKDNKKYAIGETFETSALWYTCTNSGVKCVGCVHDGNRMKDGDRYTVGDVEYRCAVDGDETAILPFSCIQHDQNGAVVERRIGCHWEEGQYEWTCKRMPDNKTAVKVQTRCNYKMAQGSLLIEPGCLKIVDQTAIGCKQGSDGQLSIQLVPADQVGQTSGLRKC
jgi:hypothetical protein